MWRKGNPRSLLVGMQISAATVENSMEIPQKSKNGSAFWLSNPTSGNISEGTQNTNLKDHKPPYVHCSVTYNCQDMEAAQVSISRWIDKITLVHLHNGILLRIKKEGNLTFFDSMDGPGECYAEGNKPVRERQVPYDFTYMWNLIDKIKNKIETDS